jgi:hypothetical protein
VLSDYEQKMLMDVERRLQSDDPGFVRSFEEQLCRPPSLQPQIGSTGKITIAVALLFSVVLLLAGFVEAAVTCAITGAMTWGIWRFPDGPTGKQSDTAG